MWIKNSTGQLVNLKKAYLIQITRSSQKFAVKSFFQEEVGDGIVLDIFNTKEEADVFMHRIEKLLEAKEF